MHSKFLMVTTIATILHLPFWSINIQKTLLSTMDKLCFLFINNLNNSFNLPHAPLTFLKAVP